MSNNYQQGELVVDSISIVNPERESIDISRLVTNITLFEAIDKPFISGRISVVDGLEIVNLYKLVGQESLTLKIRQREGVEDEMSTPEFSIDATFRIYSVSDVEIVNDTMKAYVIHFVDPKHFICTRTNISQTLRGSYSNMLLQVLEENAGFKSLPKLAYEQWDESEPGHHQLIVPNWNIMKLISFVCENAEMKGNKSWKNSMFFYQTINGEFRFDSFQSMTGREFPIPFDTMPRNSSPSEFEDLNKPITGLNTQILGYKVDQRFNTMMGATSGAYASKLKTYDPIRKLEEENVYSITKVFERSKDSGHTSKFPIIRTNEPEITYKADDMLSSKESPSFSENTVDLSSDISYDSYTLHKVNMTNAFSDEAKLIDATGNVTLTQQKGQEYRDTGPLERRALLSILSQNTTTVTIPFRSDMSVGNMVRLNLPTSEIRDDDSAGDELVDDRYLITRMTMSIDPLNGTGSLMLSGVKDSYGVDIKTYNPAKSASGPEEN